MKICGLRTAEAVDAAVESGADAIGFVFASGSPRYIEPSEARELIARIQTTAGHGGVETVAVVRNQPIDDVIAMAKVAGVTAVQLHGSEPESDAQRVRDEGFGCIRALSIDGYLAQSEVSRDRLLIDAVEPGAGLRFDGNLLVQNPPTGPWILAGGLEPSNVAAAIEALGPTGVDVSSGVESERGVKSVELIREFIRAARTRG